jgi:hypothetical protein
MFHPGVLLGAVLLALPPAAAHAQRTGFTMELEGGPVWQSYNDVEIPNDGTATRFSLSDLAGTGPWAGGRLYITAPLGARHRLRLLVAPFSLTETGTPSRALEFAGESYTAGTPLDATYTFNSYRLTYRYQLHEGERSSAWAGFTAKIRDAEIALVQGATASRKDDFGFVPLLHMAGEWRFGPAWYLIADLDGLAGGPGRAVDATLKLGRELDARWALRVGYRMVEGGADVDDVYTFAWLHHATVSLVLRL